MRTTQPRLMKRRLLMTGSMAAILLSSGLAVQSHVAQGAPAHAGSSSTLSIGWNIETKTLDPAGKTENPDIWVQVNMFDRLVDVASDGKTIEPDLATTWTSAKNGTVYTFFLRKGIKFQNGAPITAKDVVFCVKRAQQKARLWSWTLSAVKNVTAVNKSTVRFTLSHPWGPFLSDLSLFNTGIYPAAYYKTAGESGMASHPVGSGPYKFVTWKRGQYIRLQKDPHYWNARAYPLKGVEYRLIPNDNSRMLQTEAGQLDVDNILPYNQVASVQKSGRAQVQVNPSTETLYIVPNHKVPQMADVNVRQAMNHAIDRKGLVRAALFGHGVPAGSFMPKGALYWNRNVAVPKYDLKLAKQYMKKSKYPHGFAMTMEVGSGDSLDNEIDVILKSELQPLGIKLNLRQVDATTNFNNQDKGQYHMTNNRWTNDITDPDELVSFAVDYSLGSKAFFTWNNNKQLTRLSQQAEKTNNQAQRKAIYFKIQQIFAQQVPFFPLFYVPYVNAVSSNVHGFSENPLGYFNLKGVTKSG